MDKFLKRKLVSRLKGFEQEAKMLRSHINKAKDKKRPLDNLQSIKMEIGWDARHHLLAYAYLRKMPYHLLEPNCRLDNKPNIELILTITESFFDWQGKAPTKEKVESWLMGTSVVEISTQPEPNTEKIEEYKPNLFNKVLSFLAHSLSGIR